MKPALKAELERLLAEGDSAAHLQRDPIRFVHRYPAPHDREVVSIFAALLAYGRVTSIGKALEDVVARLGPHPFDSIRRRRPDAEILTLFDGFVYRLTRGVDLARLWQGLSAVIAEHGTLGGAMRAFDDPEAPDLTPAIVGLSAAVRAHTRHFEGRRAFAHLLSDPLKNSACKRWWMWLRWMVRGPDEVDLGLWRDLGPHRLLMPLDTHIHRLGLYLGLTTRRQADRETSRLITDALKTLSPEDPVRYDFALAHMGISGQCPTKPVKAVCEGCDLKNVCQL